MYRIISLKFDIFTVVTVQQLAENIRESKFEQKMTEHRINKYTKVIKHFKPAVVWPQFPLGSFQGENVGSHMTSCQT